MRKDKTQNTRIPMSDGTFIAPESKSFAGNTLGQSEVYRPAQHRKPLFSRLLESVLSVVRKANTQPDCSETSEQGASAAASPSTYQLSLYAQRYERRQKIADCRQMILDDPRARRATLKFAREAFRKGVTVVIPENAKVGLSQRKIQQAQEICDHVVSLMPANKLVSWGWMLIVEGDLFLQGVLSKDREVVSVKKMPAVSMERLTDDTDEFIDPAKAFVQLDTTTNETISTFSQAIMCHLRWNHIDGERYGEPEVVAGRRMRRLLELQEEAQAIRRMTRASQRVVWNIGTEEKPAKKEDVEDFKRENGFLEGTREIFDPNEVTRDFFGNGMLSATPIDADEGVSDVEDLKYMQDVYSTSALPTPPSIYGLNSESINRDVLEDHREEWLKEIATLCDVMREGISFFIDLALLLAGILPETVPYQIHFSESSIETPSEVVDRVIKLRSNATPDYQPDPLLTKRKAIQLLAEFIDVENVDEFLEELEKEKLDAQKEQMQLQEQQMQLQQKYAPEQQEASPASAEAQGGQETGSASPDAQGASQSAPAMAPRLRDVFEDEWVAISDSARCEDCGAELACDEEGYCTKCGFLWNQGELPQMLSLTDEQGTHWVMIDGKPIPITGAAIHSGHIKDIAKKFNLSSKAHKALLNAHNAGAITTDKHLYHALAIAHAHKAAGAAKGTYNPENPIYEGAINSGLAYGGDIAKLNEAAQNAKNPKEHEKANSLLESLKAHQGKHFNAQIGQEEPQEQQSEKQSQEEVGLHHVNINGKQIPITNQAISEQHILDASKQFKLSTKAKNALLSAYQSGKIPTDKELYHTLAIAHAHKAVGVSKGTYNPDNPIYEGAIKTGLSHGTIEGLKASAEEEPDQKVKAKSSELLEAIKAHQSGENVTPAPAEKQQEEQKSPEQEGVLSEAKIPSRYKDAWQQSPSHTHLANFKHDGINGFVVKQLGDNPKYYASASKENGSEIYPFKAHDTAQEAIDAINNAAKEFAQKKSQSVSTGQKFNEWQSQIPGWHNIETQTGSVGYLEKSQNGGFTYSVTDPDGNIVLESNEGHATYKEAHAAVSKKLKELDPSAHVPEIEGMEEEPAQEAGSSSESQETVPATSTHPKLALAHTGKDATGKKLNQSKGGHNLLKSMVHGGGLFTKQQLDQYIHEAIGSPTYTTPAKSAAGTLKILIDGGYAVKTKVNGKVGYQLTDFGYNVWKNSGSHDVDEDFAALPSHNPEEWKKNKLTGKDIPAQTHSDLIESGSQPTAPAENAQQTKTHPDLGEVPANWKVAEHPGNKIMGDLAIAHFPDGSTAYVRKMPSSGNFIARMYNADGEETQESGDTFDTPQEAFDKIKSHLGEASDSDDFPTNGATYYPNFLSEAWKKGQVLNKQNSQGVQKAAFSAQTVPPSPLHTGPHFVTINGNKIELDDNKTVDKDEAKTLAEQAGVKLTPKGVEKLDALVDSGEIKTHSQLMQKLALAQAASHAAGVNDVGGTSFNQVAGVKSIAEAKANASAHKNTLDKLGATSILTPEEEKTAKQAAIKHEFETASPDDLMHKFVATHGGSNEGGEYETKSGQKVYVKFYNKNGDQAHAEHLSNAVYNALGLDAPVSKVFSHNGKQGYASQWMDSKGELGEKGNLTKASAKEVLNGFAADVLLGNWDAVGTGLNNVKVTQDGKIARIDNGGSLWFKATGGDKEDFHSGEIHEWDTLAPGGKMPYYAQVFKKAGIDSAEDIPNIGKQVDQIVNLSKQYGGWKNFIAQHAPDMPEAMQKKAAAMLDARTSALAAKAKEVAIKKKGVWGAIIDSYSQGMSNGGEHWPVSHKTEWEGAPHMDKIFADQPKALSSAEKSAVSTWKGSYYQVMSDCMYNKQHDPSSWPSQVHETIKHLDAAFAKPESKAKEPFIVHRKLHPVDPKIIAQYKNMKPGEEAVVPGYSATSVGHSAGYGHGEFYAHICVPVGAPAIWVEGVQYGPGHQGEREILLNRNTKFRCLKNEYIGGTHHLTWEIVVDE